MTAQDLLTVQSRESEYQLVKVLEGLDESVLDAKPIETMMSFREQVEHLIEVYVATIDLAEGTEHEWGTLELEDKNWAPMLTDLWAKRTEAEAAILASTDDTVLATGASYLVSHDNYHIGQLATLRIALDPEWDPYCIYPSGEEPDDEEESEE